MNLADTLVAGFDVIEFLQMLTERCVELLEVDGAGIFLVDADGVPSLVAASTEQIRLLELFQLQDEEGPCLDCYQAGVMVSCPDLTAEPLPWPRFGAAARTAGFSAVTTVPMRLREHSLGAMDLFRVRPGELDIDIAQAAQALADVATIGIVHERAFVRQEIVIEQLHGALNSRVVIEQAKGVLSERGGIGQDEAFAALRSYARAQRRNLSEVARAVSLQDPEVADLLDNVHPRP
ncbi:GAF and ANTAR domain-containing protein [Spirillospora sp. CA-294931]|uniref:GAF and ANTAR domain-containing protein n=1 Tax=Spirillospora sp. CA-294931 TaxID=3240042 RepID=UPI003D94BEBB